MENSINKIVEEKLKLEKAKILEEWKLTETMIKEEWKLTETRMEEKLKMARLWVEEQLKLAETRIWTEIKMRNRTSAERNMELRFINKISQPILTGEEIKGEGNTCIEVGLFDNSTGNIVDVGSEASASVEIVVLKKGFDAFDRDDWTVEEFNEKIVHAVEGKTPLLAGNVSVKLQRGIGVFGNIKFRHHATKMKPPEFRLGARIGDLSYGIFVKEAKTESFVVKDFRIKYYRKHAIPSLSDGVWRLHNIRKGGKIDQRLKDEEINTVEEFLTRLLKDPEGLKNVVRLGLKKWEVMVNHARTCQSGNKIYCYINFQQKTGIVFDILGNVLRLYSESQYADTDMLSENSKVHADKLLSSAIEHWEDIIPLYDENSVHQYFTSIRTSVDHSDSSGSGYSGLGHYNTGATPNDSNSSFHGIISNQTNFTGETVLKDLDQFPFSIYDVETLYYSPLNIETMLPGFDNGFTNCGMQQDKDFIVDETNAGNGIVFVVPEVVIPICKALKRWKRLSCVSRLFFIRKMVASSEGDQSRKKQKVC